MKKIEEKKSPAAVFCHAEQLNTFIFRYVVVGHDARINLNAEISAC